MAGAAETLDLGQLPAALAAIGTPPKDYAALIKKFVVLLSSEAKRSFDEGSSPSGVPWAPLKRERRRKRERRTKKGKGGGGSGQKPLRNTGILMQSVTAGGVGHVEQLGPSGLVYGTTVPYAGYHQRGTRHIPARPFLGLSPRALGIIQQMTADFVARQVARAGLRK